MDQGKYPSGLKEVREVNDQIVRLLQALGIENYIINTDTESTLELFFVRKNLDMRREKDVTKSLVTVFRDFEEDGVKYRGSSEALLVPGMAEEEKKASIETAYQAAAYVRNPWYPLYHGEMAALSGAKILPDLSDAAAQMTEAIFSADTDDQAFLNSVELFVIRNSCEITSSEGVSESFEKFTVKGEYVTQCKEPKDVEQYYSFEYDGVECEAIARKVSESLKTVRDRAIAEKMPKSGSYDIVLSGDHVKTILNLYLYKANAAFVYPGYSKWQAGEKVQGEDVKGEALSIDLIPSDPVSGDGVPMKERAFLRDGELQTLFGANRFCQYLGIEPTGQYRKIRVENGTVPFEEMKKGCLYPVSFSDFQMNPFTGYFGGEIRLAYLVKEDGSVEILTGGSVNGSFIERQDDIVFSKERYVSASYEGPLAVKVKNVAVAGE